MLAAAAAAAALHQVSWQAWDLASRLRKSHPESTYHLANKAAAESLFYAKQ
jgi:hypothetical protein